MADANRQFPLRPYKVNGPTLLSATPSEDPEHDEPEVLFEKFYGPAMRFRNIWIRYVTHVFPTNDRHEMCGMMGLVIEGTENLQMTDHETGEPVVMVKSFEGDEAEEARKLLAEASGFHPKNILTL